MIGRPKRREPKLFYQFNLDAMVPQDHLLRRIDKVVDFSFARREVASLYGDRGNESVDPAVTLRLVLLLFLENVPSQRALMRQLPLRLDWLWFCGFDIDEVEQLPDHSVLTKARKLWGRETFLRLFERVVGVCVQAGLVDGSTIYADASVNAANASMDSLRTHLRVRGGQMYDALEREESQQVGAATPPVSPAPEMPAAEPRQPPAAVPEADPEPDPMLGKPLSTTDPEARLTRKRGQTILGYKDHRVIDDRCGIITATLTARGGRFADAANQHGYKRLRWRGLEEATIQHLLIATAQNLRKLARAFCRARRQRWRLRTSAAIRRPVRRVSRRRLAIRRAPCRFPARSRI